MKPTVFYFSGTGNSWSVAKEISDGLGGELVSIPSVAASAAVRCPSESIGIVFPRYYGYEIGIPLIVKDFISRLENLEDKYIFAVCTYGGGFGDALTLTDELLKRRGGRLSAGFGIHMPQNAFEKPWVNNEKLIGTSYRKCAEICAKIKDRDYFYIEKPDFLFTAVTRLFMPLFQKMIRKSMAACAETGVEESFDEIVHQSDKSFSVDSSCDRCGICQKLCPVGNIVLGEKGPSWQHRCENCLACFDWCPNKSIHAGIVTKDFRYRHPRATLSDMLRASARMGGAIA